MGEESATNLKETILKLLNEGSSNIIMFRPGVFTLLNSVQTGESVEEVLKLGDNLVTFNAPVYQMGVVAESSSLKELGDKYAKAEQISQNQQRLENRDIHLKHHVDLWAQKIEAFITSQSFTISRESVCPVCYGTGNDNALVAGVCPACVGRGMLARPESIKLKDELTGAEEEIGLDLTELLKSKSIVLERSVSPTQTGGEISLFLSYHQPVSAALTKWELDTENTTPVFAPWSWAEWSRTLPVLKFSFQYRTTMLDSSPRYCPVLGGLALEADEVTSFFPTPQEISQIFLDANTLAWARPVGKDSKWSKDLLFDSNGLPLVQNISVKRLASFDFLIETLTALTSNRGFTFTIIGKYFPTGSWGYHLFLAHEDGTPLKPLAYGEHLEAVMTRAMDQLVG